MKKQAALMGLGIVMIGIALTGCGGGESGPSDEDQVQAQAKAFTTAMSNRDQKAACNTFTDALKETYRYGCSQTVGPTGNVSDWRDLEVGQVNVSEGYSMISYASFAERKKRAIDDLYDANMCGIWEPCTRRQNNFHLPGVVRTISLTLEDEQWLVSDFSVYQP